MRTFSRRLVAFVAGNLNFLAFLAGFAVFSASLAAYSGRLAGVVSGAIVMVIAAYPFMRTR